MNIRLFTLFILILNNCALFGNILGNISPNANIMSIQFHQQGFDLGYPILSSTKETPLNLSFDLIGEEQTALAYRLIHCNSKWKKSNIPTNEFLENTFNEFYIDDYELSTATKRLYTHYTATISQKQLKLSGNYIVQVFPQDNPEEIWLQQRFVYVEPIVAISGIAERAKNKKYATHQRIQFSVKYNKTDFQNPQTNFTASILQNFRWHSAQRLKPLFTNNQLLQFNYIDKKGLFSGNYEFPYFETSNITQKTHTINSIEQDENGETHCYISPNKTASNNYFYLRDMNGNYAIESDNTFEKNTESEYVWTHFTLLSPKLTQPIFVVGRFNNWELSERYQLFYDEKLVLYHIGLLLKQGVYNYTFVSPNIDGTIKNLLGNFSETENDYYIFIYYKDDRLQTDRAVGWVRINTHEK